jgi:hypothetical protein
MTSPHDLDRQLAAFLTDGPTELPDPSFDAVRDRMETTRQRVVLGPWRVPDMSKLVPYALGTAAVVVALVVGIQFLRPAEPSEPAAVPSVQPSATVSPPTPSTSPSASAAASTPPLTQTFTSPLHGISVSHPEGWIAQPATELWTDGTRQANSTDSFADDLYDPVLEDHLFLSFASQPLGDSTPDEWVAEQAVGNGCSAIDPIEVDGATGLINDCELMVAVTTAGRGYWIILRASQDDPAAVASYDRAWFEEVLAAVRLHPEDAVDVP